MRIMLRRDPITSEIIPMNSLRNALLLSGATLVLFHLATPASAADRLWDGSAGDSKWKTAGNWAGGATPVSGDALFFAGTVGTVNTNDFTAGTAFGGLNFNGPGSFAIWGNTVTLSGNVTNNQVSTLEAINVPLSLGVAMEGNIFAPVVPRGQTVPTIKKV